MNNNSPITHIIILDLDKRAYIETNSGEFIHHLSTFNLQPDKEADYGDLGRFWYFSCTKSLLGDILYEAPSLESPESIPTYQQGDSESPGGSTGDSQTGENS